MAIGTQERKIVLTLSEPEALALFDVLGRVGGTGERVQLIEGIYGALAEIDLEIDEGDDDDVEGEIRFVDAEDEIEEILAGRAIDRMSPEQQAAYIEFQDLVGCEPID